MRKVDVSVIIVNYNTRDLLANCLRSIRDKTSGVSYEIIVVDNASTDGSVDMVKRNFPGVRLIASVQNLGFGKGNNLGMKEALGKYYLLLNSDTVLMNNAIKIMYDFMQNEGGGEKIAICGASLFDMQDRPAISFGQFPKPFSMTFYSLPLPAFLRRNRGVVRDYEKDYECVDYVAGADFFCRKDVIDETGMFDEHYFAYYEETDLSKRISLRGFKSAVVHAARIHHLEGQSFKNNLSKRKIMFESSLYYLHKFHRDSVFFKPYCMLNELKYSLYRLAGPPEHKLVYAEMISRTRSLRGQNNG